MSDVLNWVPATGSGGATPKASGSRPLMNRMHRFVASHGKNMNETLGNGGQGWTQERPSANPAPDDSYARAQFMADLREASKPIVEAANRAKAGRSMDPEEALRRINRARNADS